MKHFGKTPEEQLEKNQPLLEWLKQKINQEVTESEAKANHEALESLKETIDNFRPEGHKLFSDK
ncbi:MAG: hypothetical protein WBB28_28130 [Crinalium sp.]